jgi:hypothetical protein
MENTNRLEKNELSFDITKKKDAVEVAIEDREGKRMDSILKNEDIARAMTYSHVDMVQNELSILIDKYEQELDLKRFKELKGGAKLTLEWDYHGPDGFNTNNSRIQRRWNQTLLNRVEESGLLMHKDVCNISKYDEEFYPLCIVTSNEDYGIVCSNWNFRSDMGPVQEKNFRRTRRDGYMIGRDGEEEFKVYINSYIPQGTILICSEEDLFSKELEDFVSICINIKGYK